MRQTIYNWKKGVLALHVELRLELPFGKEVAAKTSKACARDFGEQVCATGSAAHPLSSLDYDRSRLSFDDLHHTGRIDCVRRIGCPMSSLTVIAMTVDLQDRLAHDS